MSDILCVTNMSLCREDFLIRIEKIAKEKPKAIILREKNLDENEYRDLAGKVMEICRKYGTACILHSFIRTAIKLKAEAIHLPLPVLRQMSLDDKAKFSITGASCHSVQDAIEAEKLGCTYITAGHIFNTDCKKDLPGRGLDFLNLVCSNVTIPVYAIGGISHDNFADVRRAGAKGACVMSGIMRCENVKAYLEGFKQ